MSSSSEAAKFRLASQTGPGDPPFETSRPWGTASNQPSVTNGRLQVRFLLFGLSKCVWLQLVIIRDPVLHPDLEFVVLEVPLITERGF
jgi:hypothetical protein